MAMTQTGPGAKVVITEQSDRHVVIENQGEKTMPYAVYFISQTGLRRLMAVKSLVDTFKRSRQ